MPNKPDEDDINNTNSNNVTTDAEVKKPNNLSKAEPLDKPSGSRLKTILKHMETRKKQVLAGIIALILIVIGGMIYYKLSNYFWEAKQRRIAEKKCKEYTKYACDHPLSLNSSQLILGENVTFGMYPHMAFIEFGDAAQKKGYASCSGSLISEEFVLSAGHCIENLPNISGRVSLGVVDVSVDHPYHLIKNAYPHPLYGQNIYDFLLLELSEKVTFTPYLRPICLNTEFFGKYDRIVATGWGVTEGEKFSDVLKSVQLAIDGVIQEICTEFLRRLFSSDEAKQLICAGWPNSSRSVYSGDSGGPLQVISDSQCANTYVQIGVTSESENPIANLNVTLTSLFGKVANVVPWIASTVWPNESA